MMFVWKTTCRRLQTSGALARFADGEVSAQERGEIEAHLGLCPACQAVVADAATVAVLLRTHVPTVPSNSLAASGNLWATLEAKIAQTPQEKVISAPVRAPEPERRLQRFGQWLAKPGALPFGAVAAAAVGLVGIAVYRQGGVTPTTVAPASVVAMKDLDSAEISIIASPKPRASLDGVAKVAKAAAPMAARPGALSATSQSHSETNFELAPLKSKVSVRQSATAQRENRAIAAHVKPSAPREQVLQVAKAESYNSAEASVADSASDVAAVTSAAPAISAPMPLIAPATPMQAPAASESMAGQEPKKKTEASPLPPPAPVQMAKAKRAMAPAPATRESRTQGFASASADSRISADKPQDISNASSELSESSLMDIVIQQRRQRTLFSYATR